MPFLRVHTIKTAWLMVQVTGESYKTEKCIKLIFSLMQKTTLSHGFGNALISRMYTETNISTKLIAEQVLWLDITAHREQSEFHFFRSRFRRRRHRRVVHENEAYILCTRYRNHFEVIHPNQRKTQKCWVE